MPYKVSGTMLTGCECTGPLCPCNVDGTPNTPSGECQRVIVLAINRGSLDELDLTGVDAGLVYRIPGKPSGGGWRVGLIIDERASEEQAGALERIFRGEEGGLWQDLSRLFSEWLGVERAGIHFSHEGLAASLVGVGQIGLEPYTDAEGKRTQVKNAIFGWDSAEFAIGQALGSIEAFGISFEAACGDTQQFEWTS